MRLDNDDPWPPTEAKPGDTWGAYVMCEDGWWRLRSVRALTVLRGVRPNLHRQHRRRLRQWPSGYDL